MASPLAQMLAGAIGGGGPPMPTGGVRAPGALGAGPSMPAPAPGLQSSMPKPPPLRSGMPGSGKPPLPGKKPAKPAKDTKKADSFRRER